jgi:hypothetical protein
VYQNKTPYYQRKKQAAVRAMVLSAQEIVGILAGTTNELRVAIDNAHLKGFNFDYDDNHDPIVDLLNGRLGVFTKKESGLAHRPYDRGIIYSPFDDIGTQIWVRESWRVGAYKHVLSQLAVDYQASPEITHTDWIEIDDDSDGTQYRALFADIKAELTAKGVKPQEDGEWSWEAGKSPLRWQSAYIMPAWASRLSLVITDVRVERSLDNAFNWEFVANFIVTKATTSD